MSNTETMSDRLEVDQGRFTVRAAGREWLITRTADLDDLWERMDDLDGDERIPYWTEIWPAAAAMAEWLLEKAADVRGLMGVDLGCGLGLTTMAGCLAGARVLCLDYEFDAVKHALRNAGLNNVPPPLATMMDWREPAVKPGSFSFVWGADVLYEKRFAPGVARFLDYALEPGGRAWLADPGRNFFAEFDSELADKPFKRTLRERRKLFWNGRDVQIYMHEFTKIG
jgi:predicted nicotinamide N-methyase